MIAALWVAITVAGTGILLWALVLGLAAFVAALARAEAAAEALVRDPEGDA